MQQLPKSRRHRITIRGLLVDMSLLAICLALVRLLPARAAVVGAILFGLFCIVVLSGRFCAKRRVMWIGATLGATLIGPALVIPAVFAQRPPSYPALIVLLPISCVACSIGTLLFFVSIQWVQHLLK